MATARAPHMPLKILKGLVGDLFNFLERFPEDYDSKMSEEMVVDLDDLRKGLTELDQQVISISLFPDIYTDSEPSSKIDQQIAHEAITHALRTEVQKYEHIVNWYKDEAEKYKKEAEKYKKEAEKYKKEANKMKNVATRFEAALHRCDRILEHTATSSYLMAEFQADLIATEDRRARNRDEFEL